MKRSLLKRVSLTSHAIQRENIVKTNSMYTFNFFTLFTLLALIFSLSPFSLAQAEAPGSVPLASGNYLWAFSFGAPALDTGKNTATDSSGAIYTIGVFSGFVDFDPGPDSHTLTASVSSVFISKLDSDGNYLWATMIGGSGTMDIWPYNDYDIAVDPSGFVYTTGTFRGTVDFGPNIGSLISTDEAAFISKLDGTTGDFVWAKKMRNTTGSDRSFSNAIAVDPSGNVYTTGQFNGTVDFDPGTNTFPLTSVGNNNSFDVFISKLNADGDFVWAKRMGSVVSNAYDDRGDGIAVDSTGNVYATGHCTGNPADFGPFSLNCAGDDDIFITKLDTGGNFTWAKRIGSGGVEEGHGIAVDSFGNVYTTGEFFGNVAFGATNLSSRGGADIFVSKLDTNGNHLWAKRFGSTNVNGTTDSDDWGEDIAVDSSGMVFITGRFIGNADFGPFNLQSAGGQDVFISKLDSTGDVVWAKRMGGTDTTPAGAGDWGNGIATDPSGNVYATGQFNGTADFLPDPTPPLTAQTGLGVWPDIFILKLENVSIPSTFADVPSSYWAWSWIERLYAARITSGCATIPLNYCPDKTVTRAEMAIFLEKGLHTPDFNPPAPTGTMFGDVTVDYWAAKWIESLAADGITRGCGDGLNYCPDNPVTRAEMAIFLLKSKYGSSYAPLAATGRFGDVPTTYWAADWIEQLAADGITSGCGNGLNYCPDNPVTRAEMAVFLVKTFNLP